MAFSHKTPFTNRNIQQAKTTAQNKNGKNCKCNALLSQA